MPATHGEKLYGLPGPQNSAVLMDIISKLKQDLQQSRADNNKLVDQLNCLISLVKRAWTGEQGAIIHLANIVGMEAPAFNMTDMNRNTPVPEKTRAVKNWERLSLKLVQREYEAIQREIKEKQRLFLQNRQQYMSEVMTDHQREMSRFSLHKNAGSNVADVDKKFVRCFSAKTRKEPNKLRPPLNRPTSAYRSKPCSAADMVEGTEFTMGDLVGPQTSEISLQHNQNATDSAFSSLYKMSSLEDRQPFRHRENFDDPNRYKQNHLFDPDVIFSPEMMGVNSKEPKERPFSASYKHEKPRTGLAHRPKSAIFITENKPERPLKFETTRPVSGKPSRPVGGAPLRGRRHSGPPRRPVPTPVNKKEIHQRPAPSQAFEYHETDPGHDDDNNERHFENDWDNDAGDDFDDLTSETFTGEHSPPSPQEKPPISVKVRKNDPVDRFVEELKLMNEMEVEFKKSTIQLQKKLGLESEGYVY